MSLATLLLWVFLRGDFRKPTHPRIPMLFYSLSCSIGQDGLSWEAGGGAMEVAGHGNDRPCSALLRSNFGKLTEIVF